MSHEQLSEEDARIIAIATGTQIILNVLVVFGDPVTQYNVIMNVMLDHLCNISERDISKTDEIIDNMAFNLKGAIKDKIKGEAEDRKGMI